MVCARLGSDELRAVLRLAGAEIRKRSIGRRDSPLLQLMRRVLREARVTVAEETKAAAAKKASAGCSGQSSSSIARTRKRKGQPAVQFDREGFLCRSRASQQDTCAKEFCRHLADFTAARPCPARAAPVFLGGEAATANRP
jgi:hypothetical protein